jgi:hypothetical protein
MVSQVSTGKVDTLVERAFASLSLLALLPLHQISYRGVPPLKWYLNRYSGKSGDEDFTSLSLLALLPPHQIRYRGVSTTAPMVSQQTQWQYWWRGLHLPLSSCPPPSASDQV